MASHSPPSPPENDGPPCIFRTDVRRVAAKEVATCQLLQQITELDGESCQVDRSACELCSRASLSPAARLNPVLPSLLFSTCIAGLAKDLPDSHQAKLNRLLYWAGQHVERPIPERLLTYACDVVIYCTSRDASLDRAIQGILAQNEVEPVIHLINDGGSCSMPLQKYEQHPQIIVHHDRRPRGYGDAVQNIIPRLRTPYFALQDPNTVSQPDRLLSALTLLEEKRLDVVGSLLRVGENTEDAHLPKGGYRETLPAETLVFRRASFVDLGGFQQGRADAAQEFLHRAFLCGQQIQIIPVPLVLHPGPRVPPPLGAPPVLDRNDWRTCQGQGFRLPKFACDVVLPFFGQPDFVHESIESVLDQNDVEVVLHLIDDASEIGEAIFPRWQSHPAIRTYRNTDNIGPFASFNNALQFLETDFVAVQDADDVSLPHRLHRAGTLLTIADCDIFGGCMETFGADQIVEPQNSVTDLRQMKPRPVYRWSRYPCPGVQYFLENPTAVMRAAAFRQLGGYASFGERSRNRTGVDTEFFARAYYSGMRFAITRDIVLRYRYHSDSATQNRMSGWGTNARAEAFAERNRRISQFQRGQAFDPRAFGALNHFQGVTRRR